uniref:Phlebovirus glycoprotein G2 fusion domain-containing protein n=1 Tax=Parascaris univalens TaxID=6257 RepID=A0A914ZFJ6_PARUN
MNRVVCNCGRCWLTKLKLRSTCLRVCGWIANFMLFKSCSCPRTLRSRRSCSTFGKFTAERHSDEEYVADLTVVCKDDDNAEICEMTGKKANCASPNFFASFWNFANYIAFDFTWTVLRITPGQKDD